MPDDKKVTLSDLSNGAKHVAAIPAPLPRLSAKTVREANIAEVAQKAPEMQQTDVVPGVIKSAIEKIPETIQRLNNESLAIVKKGQEERIERMLDSDDDNEPGEVSNEVSAFFEEKSKKYARQDFDDDGVDFDDDDDDDGFDFPINNTINERKVTMEQNKNTTPQSELDEKIHAIAESVDETPTTMEFPKPTDEDKEKLAEKAAEAYEAVTGEKIDAVEVEEVKEEVAIKTTAEETPVEVEAVAEEVPAEQPTKDTITNKANFVMSDDDLSLLDDDDIVVEKSDKAKELEEKEKEAHIEAIKSDFRKDISQNFAPVKNKIDFNTFTIEKKAISASKVLNHIKESTVNTATAVLFSTTKKVIEVSEFTATEIQKLNPAELNQNNYYTVIRDRYRMLYNHIVDPGKPATFEAWLKTVHEDDINDYYFAAYKATFGGANTLTYTCEKEGCDNIFLKEVPVMAMIKYKNDDIKKEYLDLLHNGQLNVSKDTYSAGLFQASDEYVFALKSPTLYERVFEPTLLDSKILDSFGDLITLISYIDGIYVIDSANNRLIPVDMQPVHTDPRKTVKRRIKTCATIIRTLTSDQLQTLTVETDKYDKPDSKRNKTDDEDTTPDIQYIFPECECPKCKSKINETVIDPSNMLFTRHQLGIYQRI